MVCRQGREIKILKSSAGYYLGTLDTDGTPYCRVSTQYAKTEEDAKNLFIDRDYAIEVRFCNEGKGCLE